MALRIKDNVDLKELEKFGLKYHPEQRNQYEHYSYVTQDEWYNQTLHLCIWCKDMRIKAYDDKGHDLLFDLIQAGLVEKVGEE